MSAPTLDRPTTQQPPRRTLPGPDGLVWTVLRLHRTALWVWTGYVTISAALLLWLWGPGSSSAQKAFDAFGYAGAQDKAYLGASAFLPFSGTFDSLFYDPLTLTRIAACAIAVFAAGPLIARELESGTAQLAWTQSVTPARWLAAKLAVPALLITVGTGLIVVLYRLVWDDRNHLLVAGIGPRDLAFSVGPATLANALFGLALGVLAALVLRRTLPALAVAGVGQFLVGAARGNSWPFQGSYQQPELPVHSKALTSTGTEIGDPGCYMSHKCLAGHDVTGFTRHYLPSPDYWSRQLTETGILLGLTALAVVAAFLVLRRYQPQHLTKGAAA
ncbi:hypothetical protein G3I40_36975 [Streptomyces sp. SID14478]|uniref:hypothetical protein n=1 Tax=Streptomyces sp. SID14478 TaxID=2706073 RepID=UPI0013E0835F|nr:hypothetical protein [Streptomyces sp. SID14478]NEB80765.1 hypothetical protein [Streptomyces sp. SID14478]